MLRVGAAVLIGLITTYGPPLDDHIRDENPLYCAGPDGPLYGTMDEPWIALDVGEYESGRAHCGDRVAVMLDSGETFTARAMDAGYLAAHGIVADVPLRIDPPFVGMTEGTLYNLDAARRARLPP